MAAKKPEEEKRQELPKANSEPTGSTPGPWRSSGPQGSRGGAGLGVSQSTGFNRGGPSAATKPAEEKKNEKGDDSWNVGGGFRKPAPKK
ncbi:hypothetical protein FGO68_gene1914 [Halteria grandinella]|uniref:Uncharacterized protein n=1 Tax=Halteria grandinella TaxID=5974 RepID=A0A8J8NA56_HALGN|nr:hypothetical protein FGO68_gene1914 [Halteria grandinella]